MKSFTLLCLFLVLNVVCLYSEVIYVPSQQPTIQAGINAANDGDTVLVSPGTYVQSIDFNGKNIVVASLFLTTGEVTYISGTVIDGNQSGSVVTFATSEGSDTVLEGFTITNGLAASGGGVYCSSSSPTIRNCTIVVNTVCSGTTANYITVLHYIS